MWQKVVQWAPILAGALIYSIGVNAFLLANHLTEGGFVGLAILLYYRFGIPVGLTFFLINLPLLLASWRIFGKTFIFKTFVGVAAVSAFSAMTADVRLRIHDPLLAALYAGVFLGLGLGLIFRTGATTGGADIIARLARHFRGLAMGRTLFAIDVCVIGLVALQIGYERAMYSLVALFVATRVIDFVIEGATKGKALTIISDHPDQIADQIHRQLDRGTTLLMAKGGYTGRTKQVIYCVVGREEVNRVQNIVSHVDPRAFVVVNDVHEVLGEGFTFPPSSQAVPEQNRMETKSGGEEN